MSNRKTIEHGMLLCGKSVMDDPMCLMEDLKKLVAEKLHPKLQEWIERFEEELADCDVSDRYEEKQSK